MHKNLPFESDIDEIPSPEYSPVIKLKSIPASIPIESTATEAVSTSGNRNRNRNMELMPGMIAKYVDKQLAKKLKKHQVEGVQFMCGSYIWIGRKTRKNVWQRLYFGALYGIGYV